MKIHREQEDLGIKKKPYRTSIKEYNMVKYELM